MQYVFRGSYSCSILIFLYYDDDILASILYTITVLLLYNATHNCIVGSKKYFVVANIRSICVYDVRCTVAC
jgi:hypothetical protein